MSEEIHKPQNDYILVPKKMEPEQAILDQPPYNWLEIDSEVIPEGFLDENDPAAFPKLLRAVALFKNDVGPYKPGNHIINKAKKAVVEKHRKDLGSVANNILLYLEKFPHSVSYLEEKWGVRKNIGNSLSYKHSAGGVKVMKR